MKILHTSDWHLGKKLENFSRLEEQKYILDEICNIADAQEVDLIIIAGDLFDTFNPPTEAIDLFYKSLKRLSKNGSRPIIAIAGNHDSPDRIETADPLAIECGIFFIGYPTTQISAIKLESGVYVKNTEEGFIEIELPKYKYPVRIIATPYANEHRLKKALLSNDSEAELRVLLQDKWEQLSKKYCDNNGVNILTTHLFVIPRDTKELLEEPEDEKPILHVGGAQAIYTENFPVNIQYVALGHLHRKQVIKSDKQPVVYCGSPLSYSFSEANQSKFISIVKLEPNQEAQIEFIELKRGKKLIRIAAVGMDDTLKQLKNHEQDLVELSITTDNFLSATERKQIQEAHSGIITLIPQVKSANQESEIADTININKSITELFAEYFKHMNKQEANDTIMNLFKEVIAQKED